MAQFKLNHERWFANGSGALVLGGLSAILAAGIAGCGGAKVNNSTFGSVTSAAPAVYGLEAYNAVNSGGNYQYLLETSGLASPPDSTGLSATAYVTSAVSFTSSGNLLPGLTVNGTMPLGFAPGGQYINSNFYGAVPTGATVIFRAAGSNGQSGSTLVPIDPSKVILTLEDGTTRPFSFYQNVAAVGTTPAVLYDNGPLANALYYTAPFTAPSTSGLHTYSVSIADTAGQSSVTTYKAAVLAPGDGAILAEVVDGSGNADPGVTATITNPVSGAVMQTTADSQGVIILFAAPGPQIITLTDSAGTNTAPVTLQAGFMLNTQADSTGAMTPYTITAP